MGLISLSLARPLTLHSSCHWIRRGDLEKGNACLSVLTYLYTYTPPPGRDATQEKPYCFLLLNSVFALPHYGPRTVPGIRYKLPPCPALTHQMYGYGFTAVNNYLPLPTTSSFWVRCRPNRSLPYGGTIGSSLSD